MKPQRPNLPKIELVSLALGNLRDQLVFVGGCSVDLLLTDKAAAPARVTYDVDLVAKVAALSAYHQLEKEFVKLGFKRDSSSDAPICRWRLGNLEVDLMPTETHILGFANRWYPLALQTANPVTLSNGTTIQLIDAPVFIATKFEAFIDRGKGDLLGSHDLEDIINVFDGRPELMDEILQSDLDLQQYLADQCTALLALAKFEDALQGMIFPDESLDERLLILIGRFKQIAHIKFSKAALS
jgi:predicted nucleotidyltransferase